MSARGNQVWYNGKIQPAETARISLFTHSLHYGVGAFEGIRAYRQKKGGGAIFRLTEHIERLFDSCKMLDIKIPFTVDQLVQASIDTCKANGFEECYIRPIAFTADGPLGVYPGPNPPVDVAILNWEWGKYLGDKGVSEGTKLKTSSFVRPHVNSALSKGKISGQYVMGVVAKREAIAQGFDEALMLDADGYMAEGTGENLFMIRDGVVKTSPLTSLLAGITRRTVMDYLKAQGYTVIEQRFTRDELWVADEAFLTGTAAEITPIQSLDNRPIGRGAGAGKPGPTSSKLARDYQALVRGEMTPEYARNWLSIIA
jgi:branched-chain amino acid aminotransferase